MPELPEVETVRCGLADVLGFGLTVSVEQTEQKHCPAMLPQLTGWHFVRSSLRYPLPIEELQALCGSRLLSLERRSKYLLLYFGRLDLASADWSGLDAKDFRSWAAELGLCRIVVHLGMTGVLRIEQDSPAEVLGKHDHLWLRLLRQGKEHYLIYNDVRRFGFWQLQSWEDLQGGSKLALRLGIEPLGLELYCRQAPLTCALWQQYGRAEMPQALPQAQLAEFLYGASRAVQRELKPWLLEGKVVCGVGNIYCSESLWHSKLSPQKRVGELQRGEVQALAEALQQIISAAIAGGGTTLKDFRNVGGKPGYFQQELCVYGRKTQPCLHPGCGGQIIKIVQAQRATFYCPECQK